MKALRHLVWLLVVLPVLPGRAAAPSVTPLGSLSAQLHGPVRVATDAAGNLYVTDPGAGSVVTFNAFGQQIAEHDGFDRPLAIAVASDGRIYLSQQGNGSVSVFDARWNPLYQLGVGTNEFQFPGNLAVTPRAPGTVFVADGAANVVRVYTGAVQTAQFGTNGAGNGQFDFPAGIAVATNGEVLVVDQNNDRVEVFTNAVYERQFALGSGGMFGGLSGRSQSLLVDHAGRAFVTETMQGAVNVFDAGTGAALGSFGGFGSAPGQLNLPAGIGLDGFSRLYVASANNSRVELFGVDNYVHLSVQPGDGLVPAGQNLIFTVTTGGTNSPALQWQQNGVNLAGATKAVFTVTNAAPGDSGTYAVVVGTGFGAVTNTAGPVGVLAPPAIWADPSSQAVLLGTSVTLAVVATGTALDFQWQFNGANLTGATNASLSLAGVTAAQAGQYAVQVGNRLGSVLSAPATLTVVSPPTVMDIVAWAQPVSQPFQLTLNVDPGFAYALDATTNLLDWQTIANFSDAAGLFDFMDPAATNYPSRFYRLRWVP